MYDKRGNIYINNNKYRAKNLIVADFLGKISFVRVSVTKLRQN